MPKKGQINDIIGKTFNKLTVINRLGLWKNTRQSNWLCQCSCGNMIEARSTDLKSNHTQSCGCLVGEKCSQRNTKTDDHDLRVLKRLFNTYQKGAIKRNLRFTMEIEYFDSLTRQNCHYCNAPAKIPDNKWQKTLNLTIPRNGIDRVCNYFGYISDNIVPCCYKCNQMKMAFTIKEFYDQIKAIYANISISK